MKRKTWFYLVFFGALVAIFYAVLTRLLPGFSEDRMPVLSQVQPFSFVDQRGQPVTGQTVAGKVYVADFFFTTCKGICPLMNRNLRTLSDQMASEPDFLILSHSVDPLTDSVGRLRVYGDSLKIPAERWHLLTGSKEALYHAARVSYLLDDPKNEQAPSDQQFIHTQFWALVDRSGRVRKIYDGLKKEELASLLEDARYLLNQKANGAPAPLTLPSSSH